MPKDDTQLSAAKRAYRSAKDVGNRREEARWANVIGDILKNKGEYVKAREWLRRDYEISSQFLPEKDLLPTCQSIGEVYLRLHDFENALRYQKEHLRLAKLANDLVEQQRASTQLGRTYHEMFMKSENDHSAIHKAKKYFNSAMELAQALKRNPQSGMSSFLKEYVDAHNNIGMLEMDLDNLEEAEKILSKGLKICDEEEVIEDDDGRSRLHHNLGNIYMELRKWSKAVEHIKADIMICKRIGHCQGEAKGYINLGELFSRTQKYHEAIHSYKKALDLATSMEDEDALVDQINQNIQVVKEYIIVLDEIKKEEQNFKKLRRKMVMAEGTSAERKCLRQQLASLDCLIEKSNMICDWSKFHEFAKMKKKIANELCDKENLSDSFLVIGESYQKLRNFNKAQKWYTKSWETYKLIGNLEGQALAKINVGNVLDTKGDWMGALRAFEDGYRIAVQANLPSIQLSALENMHYSHMMRFDNVEEARRLEIEIDDLKQLRGRKIEAQDDGGDCCPETETEGDDHLSNSSSDASGPLEESKPITPCLNGNSSIEEVQDDEYLISLTHSGKKIGEQKTSSEEKAISSPMITEASLKSFPKSTGSSQVTVGRKRARLILSDDEDELFHEAQFSRGKAEKVHMEDVATSNELKARADPEGLACQHQAVISPIASKNSISFCTAINVEESACSYKSNGHEEAAQNGPDLNSSSLCEMQEFIRVKIEDVFIYIKANFCMLGNDVNTEALKVQAACSYYQQLPSHKQASGLLPIISHLKCEGQDIAPSDEAEVIKSTIQGEGWIEVSINGWLQRRLIKLYIDCCKNFSETPNMKLLRKLYNLEVSEDEVIVSDAELQDISVIPLLDALNAHSTISTLNLSHNMLGNGTAEKIKQVFSSSSQKYGGLVLDLHCNLFGPTALFQICECPVLLSRLEVLNFSGNRLTDACGSYLTTILTNCKGLYSLNIERCCITTRTIQKIAEALDARSALSQLAIGYNNPISGNSLTNLLAKLSMLKNFSELNLNGIKFNKPVLESVCQLAKSSSLSGLLLGAANIGCDGACQLTESLFQGTQELIKLDLSYCGLTPQYFKRLTNLTALSSILELNLAANSIKSEGGFELASLLVNPQCCIKILVLNKCDLGLNGVIQIMKQLADNDSVEEINLAENIKQEEYHAALVNNISSRRASLEADPNSKLNFPAQYVHVEQKLAADQPEKCILDTNYDQLEVADSDDDDHAERAKSVVSGHGDSSGSMQQGNSLAPTFQELSCAISNAKNLQLLDLSNNGFPSKVAETFYAAWSSSSRSGSPCAHIKDRIIHFSIKGRCCCIKPCCRRD